MILLKLTDANPNPIPEAVMPFSSPILRNLIVVIITTIYFCISKPLLGEDAGIAERLFKSGEKAYETKAFAEAIGTWNQLISQAPKSKFAAIALFYMAKHELEVEKKPDSALQLLDQIKAGHIKNPVAADALLLRGKILASKASKASDLQEAVGEFDRVIDLFPGSNCLLQAKLQLGLAEQSLEQWPRALQNFLDILRMDPKSSEAPSAGIKAAETLDFMGDLPGCLRLLQSVRIQFPKAKEAEEAEWRINLLVKQRLKREPIRSEGPWPAGRQKWLKTPTLLSIGPTGDLYIYQEYLCRAFLLKNQEITPIGALARNAKAMTVDNLGAPLLLCQKTGVFKEDNAPPISIPNNFNPSGICLDRWQNLWICDNKAGGITMLSPDGSKKSLPSPAAVAIASLPNGGVVLASDINKSLVFLDSAAQTRSIVPYGKGLPSLFKTVIALSTDPVGNIAAIVDGNFDGVILIGPDGTLLRQATFKSLNLNGKFRAIAQDHQGGIILADRYNDQLIRLN